MATIRDVAALAGVSVATVSRVLNGNCPVSEQKRERVMQAVAELNFKPSILGRNLGRSVNRTILIVTSATSGMLFTETVRGINEMAESMGFDLLMAYLPQRSGVPQSTSWNRCLEYLEGGLAGGVILLGMSAVQAVTSEAVAGIPVVQCSETITDRFPNAVTYDNARAVYELTQRLLAQGRRRFAFAFCRKSFETEPSRFAVEREAGMRRALEEAGAAPHPELNVCCIQRMEGDEELRYEPAEETMQFYAQLPPEERPDAIICAYDTLAVACVNTLRRAGIRVPEDIAVTGFDDSEAALLSDPKLTSVHQPGREMGREAMRLLGERIAGERADGVTMMLPCRIVERGSTRAVQPE